MVSSSRSAPSRPCDKASSGSRCRAIRATAVAREISFLSGLLSGVTGAVADPLPADAKEREYRPDRVFTTGNQADYVTARPRIQRALRIRKFVQSTLGNLLNRWAAIIC